MSYEPINILPYQPDLEPDILEIEKKAVQGSWVKLEMVRDSYISRAKVFQCHGSFLGYNENGQLVGAVIGAKVPMKINGKEFKAGFGLDLRVIPYWKNKGAGKQLTNFVMRNFFQQQNLTKNFITLKASNNPMMKIGVNMLKKFTAVDFTYLVMPSYTRVKDPLNIDKPLSFSVELLDEYNRFPGFITAFRGGLCAWHTHMMYKIKIKNIHPIARFLTWVVSMLNKKKYPTRGEEIKTATIFNLNRENIVHINEVFEHMDKCDVKFVNVICRRTDAIYTKLKPYSLFSYDHYMLADFAIEPSDQISIDVRCL
ncbi:MAG TPA: GNAT family N-acetyltransferase [Chitinophagaceae bacterium]|nr:GNAT family N-acetyltransferase [Chitinophagaceae bacterium]